MTVKELIALLETLPQDAPVTMLHYWDADDSQYDSLSVESISIERAKPMLPKSVDLYVPSEEGDPVVVIR